MYGDKIALLLTEVVSYSHRELRDHKRQKNIKYITRGNSFHLDFFQIKVDPNFDNFSQVLTSHHNNQESKIDHDQPSNFKRKRLYKGLEVSTLKPISPNNFNCKL